MFKVNRWILLYKLIRRKAKKTKKEEAFVILDIAHSDFPWNFLRVGPI